MVLLVKLRLFLSPRGPAHLPPLFKLQTVVVRVILLVEELGQVLVNGTGHGPLILKLIHEDD